MNQAVPPLVFRAIRKICSDDLYNRCCCCFNWIPTAVTGSDREGATAALPDDVLKTVMREEDKEDRTAANGVEASCNRY
jgi:hypothetical protein